MADMFQSTTIPILEQVVSFTQNRHEILAGNLANMDTPGYVSRDLSVDAFQSRLKQAIDARHRPVAESSSAAGASSAEAADPLAKVNEDSKSILFHDESQVGTEYQASEMAKNRLQHNLALSILVQQFRLLQSAISEKV